MLFDKYALIRAFLRWSFVVGLSLAGGLMSDDSEEHLMSSSGETACSEVCSVSHPSSTGLELMRPIILHSGWKEAGPRLPLLKE